MQIITIYQGASGSGDEVAVAVAQALGYRPIDRRQRTDVVGHLYP